MTTNLHAPVIEDHRGLTVANFVTFCPLFFSKWQQKRHPKIFQKSHLANSSLWAGLIQSPKYLLGAKGPSVSEGLQSLQYRILWQLSCTMLIFWPSTVSKVPKSAYSPNVLFENDYLEIIPQCAVVRRQLSQARTRKN